MRIISIGSNVIENEFTCTACKTIFAFTKRDCFSNDGYNSRVQCPVCRCYMDLKKDELPQLPYIGHSGIGE